MAGTVDRNPGADVRGRVAFRLLGPIAVEGDDGSPVALGPPRHRACLAVLLVHGGRTLSVPELVQLLWDGTAPPSAPTMVHSAVAGLRRVLEPFADAGRPMLVTRPDGYALEVGADDVDAAVFERLAARGRRLVATAPALAVELFTDALGLWRGPALAGIDVAFAEETAARWERLRLDCIEERAGALLDLGRHAEVVADLEDLVHRHPFRERLWRHLVLGLYRCGRQADALARLRTARRLLADELGVEPGPELRALEAAVLHQEDLALAPRVTGGRPPVSVDGFVGRVRELAEIVSLTGRHRLVTLTGPAGSGKSRLAQEAARDMGRDAGREVLWVDLAPLTSADLVPAAVADVLGVRTAPGQGLVGTIAAAFTDRDAVLVLDNCEHLAEACASFVRSLLATAPTARLLITSREALRVAGEQICAVRPLPVAQADDGWPAIAACEAVQLFVERASAARPGFALTPADASVVLDICRRLDGLPLALELAAARAAALPLADLAARLDDRFRLLDAAVRSDDVRHRGLTAAIGWSYDLLAPAERLLLDRVAIFPAAFTTAAAEAVAADGALPREDVPLLLARLVGVSCVQLGEEAADAARFRLLETTREFAKARLDAESVAVLRHRHAGHVLDLAERAQPHLFGPTSPLWLARLRADHDDVRAVLDWAFGPAGDARAGARLVACLWHPWDLRGIRDEGLHWVRAALAAIGPAPAAERLPLLSAGALFHLGQGEFAAAEELAGEQLVLARATTDRAWIGDGLRMQAAVAWVRGRYDEARHRYEDAITASLAGEDPWRAALAAAHLGRLHRDRDEPDAARAVLQRALDLAEGVGEPLALGLAVDVLASVEQRWGRLPAARRLADEALAHYRAVGYVEGEASALALAGRIALAAGEPSAARDAFAQALGSCRRIGHRAGSAAALEGLARVAGATDDDEWAALLLGAASAVRAEIGQPLTGRDRAEDLGEREGLAARLGPAELDSLVRRGAGLAVDELLGPRLSSAVSPQLAVG